MEELINDIENISINSNNAEDSNTKDPEKNDNFYDHQVLLPSNIQFEDYSILSLTPTKDGQKDQFRNCILCRDYSSPICKECSSQSSKTSSKSKLKNLLIPDGKVKALAKQFEEILPEALNSSSNLSIVNDDCTLEGAELINFQIDLSSDSIIEHESSDIKSSSNTDEFDCVSNVFEDLENHIIKPKTSKQLTPIKDPNLCEQIDPIKAIITSSINFQDETSKIRNCELTETQISPIKTDVDNVFEFCFSENDLIFDKFELLNPIEQRALLLKWITDTLNQSGASSKLSKVELDEIIKILKGIVHELEGNKSVKEIKNSPDKVEIMPQSIKNNKALFKKNGNVKVTRDEFQIHKNKNSKINMVNSKLQINIGIPEDEEIEEVQINELILKKYNHFGSGFESNSIIIDESSLSPKSEIALDEELTENSIKEIGNNFFGFFK